MTVGRTAYRVAAINPCWRWAVALGERPDLPAVPFFRKAKALAFCEESRARLPKRTAVLLRRRWRSVAALSSAREAPQDDV